MEFTAFASANWRFVSIRIVAPTSGQYDPIYLVPAGAQKRNLVFTGNGVIQPGRLTLIVTDEKDNQKEADVRTKRGMRVGDIFQICRQSGAGEAGEPLGVTDWKTSPTLRPSGGRQKPRSASSTACREPRVQRACDRHGARRTSPPASVAGISIHPPIAGLGTPASPGEARNRNLRTTSAGTWPARREPGLSRSWACPS